MQDKDCHFQLFKQNLFLHPHRCLYWREAGMILAADLHLGKAGHFRKAGIPVPVSVHEADLNRLSGLIRRYDAGRCLILGDLFHSESNQEWKLLDAIVDDNPGTSFELIPGNHDLVKNFNHKGLKIHEKALVEGPFMLTHEPPKHSLPDEPYVICGHLHPAVLLNTGPRQSYRADCFWFGRNVAVLPAFGGFTGRYTIPQEFSKRDKIFAIADEEVLLL